MVTEGSGRSRMTSASGVQYFTKQLPFLALASLLVAGCSSHEPTRFPAAPDQCLIAGPVNSTEYDRCVKDREIRKAEALEELLDNDAVRMQVRTDIQSKFQESDFPATPLPGTFAVVDSISATEKQALPFKARITWKYSSPTHAPGYRVGKRMAEMEKLILPALQDKGLAKWICTVTGGGQREWIFYTQSDEAFIARTQAVLAQTGPYPIELTAKKEAVSGTELQSAENLTEDIRMTPKKCME
ncbi:DUF695 domain-containing protein [Pseudomonas gozinkensis]|uniref:DUF695 domain-containing protein n=1 Tax=Pseudomonas gozinkensis TaxID=2774461 RepID=UPI001787F7F3|nr:DUF695 domain-containing protein [Pseudomonas gozinkensis]